MNLPSSLRNNASRACAVSSEFVSRKVIVRDEINCIFKFVPASRRPRRGLAALLVLIGEFHADLRSVDPDQFAAAKRQARRRQRQEEFARPQHIGRSLDFQFRAALRDVEQHAAPSPRAVDAHQVDGMGMLEPDAQGASAFTLHRRPPAAAALEFWLAPAAGAAGISKRTVYWAADT